MKTPRMRIKNKATIFQFRHASASLRVLLLLIKGDLSVIRFDAGMRTTRDVGVTAATFAVRYIGTLVATFIERCIGFFVTIGIPANVPKNTCWLYFNIKRHKSLSTIRVNIQNISLRLHFVADSTGVHWWNDVEVKHCGIFLLITTVYKPVNFFDVVNCYSP